MNQYDARQQFIEGLERYVSGIENDDGLTRLADHVSKYHDRMPSDAYEMVSAIGRFGGLRTLTRAPLRSFGSDFASAHRPASQQPHASSSQAKMMVSRWLGMREMLARRAQANAEANESAMADREQKGNREKRKLKKEKPKDAPAVSSYKEQFGKSAGKRK